MESLALYAFCNILNIKSAVISVVLVNRFNDKRYNISFQKLLNLGWKQSININQGLKNLI